MYVSFWAWRANEGGTTDLPDYSETAAVTQSCLKTKLQIYTAPEMAHTFCGCNTEIIVEVKCNKSLYDKFSLYKFGWRKWDDYKADLTTWWTMQK
jgi:hypothetical protein